MSRVRLQSSVCYFSFWKCGSHMSVKDFSANPVSFIGAPSVIAAAWTIVSDNNILRVWLDFGSWRTTRIFLTMIWTCLGKRLESSLFNYAIINGIVINGITIPNPTFRVLLLYSVLRWFFFQSNVFSTENDPCLSGSSFWVCNGAWSHRVDSVDSILLRLLVLLLDINTWH